MTRNLKNVEMTLESILEDKIGQDNYYCLNIIAKILSEQLFHRKKFPVELELVFLFIDANI